VTSSFDQHEGILSPSFQRLERDELRAGFCGSRGCTPTARAAAADAAFAAVEGGVGLAADETETSGDGCQHQKMLRPQRHHANNLDPTWKTMRLTA
jgi:hypothetical protein